MTLGFANELNEVKFGPFIVTNESCIFIIITVHFCVVIASDVLLALQNSLRVRLILIMSVNKTYAFMQIVHIFRYFGRLRKSFLRFGVFVFAFRFYSTVFDYLIQYRS